MQNDLPELKNRENTSVNWLRAIGVYSREHLQNKGAVEAYNKIKGWSSRVSTVPLHGATLPSHCLE